ncbi:MAG: SAM-dependent methyltransferase, MidA [uncultured Thermomicrobiales bacterium]|uniref:SAM-dependent methyltransferase, MidA n=1 Tax=uncultured Thermomicrobiales bacterium TaxID=1645740 RepID=A0A6J4VES9_9BACT|nr:MAG: SAM-dependent methyltransferase, MidA [uncultured Thermomicrobiales bacterium]
MDDAGRQRPEITPDRGDSRTPAEDVGRAPRGGRVPDDGSGDPALVEAVTEAIASAGGRITFARFMDLALYHPEHGYYLAAERRPGRGGDFLTAPEASPLFGLALARQVAECWERLGRPEPFVVREYGAGVGGLAYDIIAGLSDEAPAAAAVLRYRLVEPNRRRVEQALAAMAEVGLGDIVSAEAVPGTPSEGVPGGDLEPIVGVALANEVADALPVHRLVVRGGAFRERYVVRRDGPGGARFGEEEGEPSSPELGPALWDRLAAEGVILAEGDRVDTSPASADWFAAVGRGLARGFAIVLDYGYAAAELYRDHRLQGTVRAHLAHTVNDEPLLRVGRQDLTAHVDFTALQRAGETVGLRAAGLTTQGAFLTGLGLGDFLVRMQADPSTTPAEYYAAQAAVLRLIDPGGMGRFRVLIMGRDVPLGPPLRGLSVPPPAF